MTQDPRAFRRLLPGALAGPDRVRLLHDQMLPHDLAGHEEQSG